MNKFIAQVYSLLVIQLLLSAGIVFLIRKKATPETKVLIRKYSILFWLVSILIIFGIIFVKSTPGQIILFTLFSICTGLALFRVPMSEDQFKIATFGTIGIFLSMTAYALFTKRNLIGWGPYLFMTLTGLFISGLVLIIFPNEKARIVYTCLSLILFSLYVAYDTQLVMKRQAGGLVPSALGFYLDIINIFQDLISLTSN